jgi:hypothetical protein
LRRLQTILLILILFAGLGSGFIPEMSAETYYGVGEPDINQINYLFRQNGIKDGYVVRDGNGKVELIGVYNDEREVDLAFSLAQTVVGVNWVSSVTPQNIKVKEWERCLELILSGQVKGRCGPQPLPKRSADLNAPGQVANKYALVVGVGRFKNGIQTLQYASKDASDFYSYLVDPRGGNFRKENVIFLRDEYATREAAISGMNRIKALAEEDDLVVLYLSSHGTPPDKFGGVHVVTYDSEVKPRQRIWETSITEDILRDFVQGVRAKRLIVVMDACYSNGAYTQITGFLPSGSKVLGAEDEGYGRSKKYMSQRLLGAKDIVLEEPTNVASQQNSGPPNGWGKVLISASDSGERSWESDTLRSSIFTYYFLQGLKGYNGTIKESFDYSKPLVERKVKEEKGIDIDQHPQLTPSRRDWNMSIAVGGG